MKLKISIFTLFVLMWGSTFSREITLSFPPRNLNSILFDDPISLSNKFIIFGQIGDFNAEEGVFKANSKVIKMLFITNSRGILYFEEKKSYSGISFEYKLENGQLIIEFPQEGRLTQVNEIEDITFQKITFFNNIILNGNQKFIVNSNQSFEEGRKVFNINSEKGYLIFTENENLLAVKDSRSLIGVINNKPNLEIVINEMIRIGLWQNLHLENIENIGNLNINNLVLNQSIDHVRQAIKELSRPSLNRDQQESLVSIALAQINRIDDKSLKTNLSQAVYSEREKREQIRLIEKQKEEALKREEERKMREMEIARALREKENERIRIAKENERRRIEHQKAFKLYEQRLKEFENARKQAIIDFERAYKRKQNKFEKSIFDRNWATERSKIQPPSGYSFMNTGTKYEIPKLLPPEIKHDEEFTKPEPPPEELPRKSLGEAETYEPPKDPDIKGPEPIESSQKMEDEIFTAVEQQAEFPGGPRAFNEFLGKNMKYPAAAQRANVGGKVYVQFVVNVDGTIQDVQVVKSVGFGCDEEAIRVIKAVPRWNPGKQSGRAVRSRFTQPITFVLSE